MPKDRLNIPYGDLNRIEEPLIGRSFDFDSSEPINSLREAARNIYKKDSLSGIGPLKGIVLRVEEIKTEHDVSSWIRSLFGNERPPTLRSLKVRIPEIHAMLPEPETYGDEAGASHKIIDMYPTFISISEEIAAKPVAPGDIVYVDFGNRENLSDPQYLGPVFKQALPGIVAKKSTQSNFNDKKKINLGTSAPNGDQIGGDKNLNNQIPRADAPIKINILGVTDTAEEQGHSTSGRLPPMKQQEQAYIRGKAIGLIDLTELPSPQQATKTGVFVANTTLDAWQNMVVAAKKDGIILKLNSGFRSFDQQKYLYDNYRAGNPGFNVAAAPGYSNHQSGIAFDVAGTKGSYSAIYRWLAVNAHRFGFINTGRFFKRQPEPWHYEYLGIEHPRVIKEGRVPLVEKLKSFK